MCFLGQDSQLRKYGKSKSEGVTLSPMKISSPSLSVFGAEDVYSPGPAQSRGEGEKRNGR